MRDRAVARLGFWAAIATALLTAVSFGLALATPPRSGPYCAFDSCVTAPYTDIEAYFPRDYLWMFPAILIPFAFLALIACVHYVADEGRKPLTLTAVALAAMSAAIVSTDYFIQLTVIQPSVLRGQVDGLSLWSQYNPHGVFIALETIGYLLMAFTLFFVAPAFAGRGVERALRWLFILAPLAAVAALAGYSVAYGQDVEYRFEVAVISIDWTALIVGSVLLAVFFRRAWQLGAAGGAA